MNMLWPSKCYGQLDVNAQLWQGLGETRQAGRQAGRQPPASRRLWSTCATVGPGSGIAAHNTIGRFRRSKANPDVCDSLPCTYAECACKERACLSYFESGVSLTFRPCLHRLDNSLFKCGGIFFPLSVLLI